MSGKMKNITRREFVKLSAAFGLAAQMGLLSGCSSDESANEDQVLKIGYIPITDAAPLLIAYAKGFYSAEGIKAEKPVLMRGWSAISESFMAKQFNLVHLLLPIPIYMKYNLNYPVKVVAWDHLNNSAITVRADSGINTLADLGGKRIAIPYWYSMHNIIMQLCLKQYGLNVTVKKKKQFEKNETYLVVMQPPDMAPAMAQGSIDGYIVAEPFNAAGEITANGKIIRFTGDIWQNHPCCVAVMNENDIKNNPAWCQKVVNALVKAESWIINNKEETAHILSKGGDGYLPMEEKVIKHSMIDYDLTTYGVEKGTGAITHPEWPVSRVGFEPYQFKSATKKVVELLKETVIEGDTEFLNKLSGNQVAEELMDYNLVTKAIENAGNITTFDGISDKEDPFSRKETIAV